MILSNGAIIFVNRLKRWYFFIFLYYFLKLFNINKKCKGSRNGTQDLIKRVRLFTGSQVISVKKRILTKRYSVLNILRIFVGASEWFYFDFGRTNKVALTRKRGRKKKKKYIYIFINFQYKGTLFEPTLR